MTSAAVSVIEFPLKVLPSSLSVMVSYFGNPEMLTVTLSPTCGTLTPRPSGMLPPGLTDSVLSATVRVGATGVVGFAGVVVSVPPVLPEDALPEEVLPVGSVTVVPPDVVPDEELPVVLPEDVLPEEAVPVGLVTVVPPDVVPDEESLVVPPEDVLPEEAVPVGLVTVVPPDVVPDEELPVVLPEVLPDEVVPPTPCQPLAAEPVTSVMLR